MDAEHEINDLRAAMRGVVKALRQLELYAEGQKPSAEGLKRLNEYINEVDKVVNPGTIHMPPP